MDQLEGSRPLTDSERAELVALSKKPGAGAWALPVLCWILTAFDLVFLVRGHMQGFRLFAFGLVLVVTIISTLKLWQGFRLKAQVLYDLDIGTLLFDHSDGEHVEHLPTSSLLWTENGEPAEWRRKRLKRESA
jgi:hypothetical protein